MRPAVAYTSGLVTGIALTAGALVWSHRRAAEVAIPSPASVRNDAALATPQSPPGASSDRTPLDPAASSAPSLESALKEIHEAGMVVIPQEFARFLMPSLLSTYPEPAVRQILQLDERETSELAKARMDFDRALQQAIDAHLQVVEVKDGVVTAKLPAFQEERQELIDAWRAASLAVLDTDSAAMAAHIDFDRVIDGFFQGSTDLTVTIKPSPDSKKFAIEYRGQTASGNHRQNHRLQMGMPGSQLLKQFPSLQPHFPQLAEEIKP